ncbi:MAG: hypothetical protein PWR06_1154 [Thermoanaerobacteraceae bacterium]|jgi:predicted amidohydrolase|uniref:Carbon-nitrogen hydrolase family protein n=1 Tax=Biomaibacter acetigenes TaxID=2316383 RepID=A0A3G2R473_9FIRM|nr:carbon-nitrogen hydrolase family protein [Biomaibacter acetigenes]AYO29727.1 carbon-nitrogen hydrolase family protein [Biomaibacter acetigenes]MDK2878438.1 hypothetical protein [Thermoanaerobacteraceae bacterium]MDN5302294.1 hypothetical protein [Thermoanaerobacteraceae bacterium]MDN5311972.1 hypothetical protein [Thermoanaerobacteraceae bacterium]
MIQAAALQLKLESKKKYVEDLARFTDGLKVDLLVLPPLAGLLFENSREYLNFHQNFSKNGEFVLVPGSFREDSYHSAVIIHRGDVIHIQCQTHLSRRDEKEGLIRGNDLDVVDTPIGKMGILIGNDCFHPQTGRILGLSGADVVACLYSMDGDYNRWLQISGIWQQVQQNQFFAVECAANGVINGRRYSGRSIIHNPIWEGSNGILAEMPEDKEGILVSVLDFEKRNNIKQSYPLFKYLNRELYKKEWGY